MTNEEIIYKIIELYEEARKPKFPAPKIIRARSHTISSEVEDLVAYFFSSLTDAEIIIDKSFTVKVNGKRKTIYPDIAIKRGNIITGFFDMKMDLGWKRYEFPTYCIEKSNIIKEIRGQTVDFWGYPIILSYELKYEIVVISKLNITKKLLNKNLKEIYDSFIENEVSIFFLTDKIHPNHRDSQFARDNIEINHKHLNELREKIKTQ